MNAPTLSDCFPCRPTSHHLLSSSKHSLRPPTAASPRLLLCARKLHPPRRSSLLVSRLCRQLLNCTEVERDSLRHLPTTFSSEKEIAFANRKSHKECSILDRRLFGISNSYSELTYYRGLKFALMFGLFSFQGGQWALASGTQLLVSMDFGSGIQSYLGDLGDISTGFASAFLLIFFSELGDKTFFIAALLAARNSWAVVFLGTFGALAAMTFISVVLGRTFHYLDGILPFSFGGADLPIDDIAAVCLLIYFGVSTLLDASSSEGLKAEEEQKEAELAVSEFSGNGAGILATASTVVSTFLLVFIAEWGDKSFFSTIALAAASSPLGVIGGALAGHAVATLLAVLGGSLLGTFFSERVVAYIGGSLFLVFAALTLIEIIT